jgi:hypothetical protein
MNTIQLSDGTSYEPTLVVLRDDTAGRWRLFWANGDTGRGVYVDSSVTGQPFFRTRRDAVDSGLRRFGVKAVRPTWE